MERKYLLEIDMTADCVEDIVTPREQILKTRLRNNNCTPKRQADNIRGTSLTLSLYTSLTTHVVKKGIGIII